MFTGLIEEIGIIAAVLYNDASFQLVIQAQETIADIELGNSIAINGVCLTVTAFNTSTFTVGLAPETRTRTNVNDLLVGMPVNLERATLPTTRLGGHYVQGHIDMTGVIKGFEVDEDSLWITIETQADLMRYIVPKGYITIDGASLTVVNTGTNWFDVMLIAYSQKQLTLPKKKLGERVNLEVDILAKYVERLLVHQQTKEHVTHFTSNHELTKKGTL